MINHSELFKLTVIYSNFTMLPTPPKAISRTQKSLPSNPKFFAPKFTLLNVFQFFPINPNPQQR